MSKKTSNGRGVNRRSFLKTTVAGAAAASIGVNTSTVRGASHNIGNGNCVVNIFMRGANDGLVTCFPHGETSMNWAITRPNIVPAYTNVDNHFGVADALFHGATPGTGIGSIYNAGRFAFVHGVGLALDQQTKSHFSAMDNWEFAEPAGTPSGWLARTMDANPPPPAYPMGPALRAMAVSTALPKSLAAADRALPIPNPPSFAFPGGGGTSGTVQAMYAQTAPPVGPAVATVFNTIDYFNNVNAFSSTPGTGYPATPFGEAMDFIARGLKEGLDMEVYEADIGGWDLHGNMGVHSTGGPLNGPGKMYALLDQLGTTLKAFDDDLASAGLTDKVLVIVQTEFGRRVKENASLGTDHGWGGCMMLMGPNNLRGGQVHTRGWQLGNLRNQLWNNEDLPAFIDYRDVLWDALEGHLGLTGADLATIFPNYMSTPLDVFI